MRMNLAVTSGGDAVKSANPNKKATMFRWLGAIARDEVATDSDMEPVELDMEPILRHDGLNYCFSQMTISVVGLSVNKLVKSNSSGYNAAP